MAKTIGEERSNLMREAVKGLPPIHAAGALMSAAFGILLSAKKRGSPSEDFLQIARDTVAKYEKEFPLSKYKA
jgi:hypothetical protein